MWPLSAGQMLQIELQALRACPEQDCQLPFIVRNAGLRAMRSVIAVFWKGLQPGLARLSPDDQLRPFQPAQSKNFG